MPGKRYVRLGKTKLVRIPCGIEDWVKEIARELDTKEDPQAIMNLLADLAAKCK